MKYLFILVAGVALSALFQYMFGSADFLKRGVFIGISIAAGALSEGCFK